MILDSKKQKEILVQLIESGNYPGSVIEEIVELKKSVLTAKIKSGETKSDRNT